MAVRWTGIRWEGRVATTYLCVEAAAAGACAPAAARHVRRSDEHGRPAGRLPPPLL